MNNLYLIKITANQAAGNQIDIQKPIAISFFGVTQDVLDGKKNMTINICHRSDLTTFEQIEIQGATNVRFSSKLNSFLAANGDQMGADDLLVVEKVGRSYSVWLIKKETANYAVLEELFDKGDKHMLLTADFGDLSTDNEDLIDKHSSILTALRTKPFVLLAGISGTGKSRLVKELAFMTCPKDWVDANTGVVESLSEDPTTPFNYCLIEVKPNWHDSSELLGYYNALDEKYELTSFIRFAYRAAQYPEIPFFVCLDEMNLAPVEQYFAEYLSVLETRTLTDKGIVSAPLLKADLFNGISAEKYAAVPEDKAVFEYIADNGLQLPSNLYIIGTVNMDDTTHQFSRKVIDRAFTIEMNGGNLRDMFEEKNANTLQYRDDILPLEAIKSCFVSANEVFKDLHIAKYEKEIKEKVPAHLEAINLILKDTPFQVSYRVQNELILYLTYLIEQAGFPDDIDSLIGDATLAILLQKILPRVQGDDKLLGKGDKNDVFTELREYVEKNFVQKEQPQEDGQVKELVKGSSLYKQVIDKLDQMHKRLENSYFANFF